MIEAGVSDVFQSLVQEVGPVLSHLRPMDSGLQKLGGESSVLWREHPYPHEVRILTGFLFVYEHEKRENPLTTADIGNLTTLLEWVHGIPTPKQTIESPVGRQAPSALLKPAAKAQMYDQIEHMQDPKFVSRLDKERQVLGFFRSHVATLSRVQILPPMKELHTAIDETMGHSFQTESV